MAGRPEQCVDLATLADEVIAMTRPLWAERARGGPVHLNRSLSDGVLVRGIAGEIREALLNLVQNALDAMPGGGTLSMCVRAADDAAVIEIGDSGSGMTPEVREHAFEPFFTTKGVSGTGLGLAEVYGIMRRHRGRAEIDSAPGAGSTLRLVFPRTEAPDEPAELAHPARRSAKRVLVVEDNDDGREFLCALLATDGHTVDAVGTVRDATARLASGSPAGVDADSAIGPALPYDVLITDVGLPDGCGWDLVTAARARWPRLRIGSSPGGSRAATQPRRPTSASASPWRRGTSSGSSRSTPTPATNDRRAVRVRETRCVRGVRHHRRLRRRPADGRTSEPPALHFRGNLMTTPGTDSAIRVLLARTTRMRGRCSPTCSIRSATW
jgi:CheY-like chemotaxis protein